MIKESDWWKVSQIVFMFLLVLFTTYLNAKEVPGMKAKAQQQEITIAVIQSQLIEIKEVLIRIDDKLERSLQ